MLSFEMHHQYRGHGISEGLHRAMLVYDDDVLLVDEGMGLGSCAVQLGGYTYFTATKSVIKNINEITTVFSVSKRLVWKVFGFRCEILTKLFENLSTNLYMKSKDRQDSLLVWSKLLRRIFHANIEFVNVNSHGELTVIFKISRDSVSIDVSSSLDRGGYKLFVMNELSGYLFNMGIIENRLVPPPTGWQLMAQPYELYSPEHALAYKIIEEQVPIDVKSVLYWGREVLENDVCWAGLESELIVETASFEHYKYSVCFREVEKI